MESVLCFSSITLSVSHSRGCPAREADELTPCGKDEEMGCCTESFHTNNNINNNDNKNKRQRTSIRCFDPLFILCCCTAYTGGLTLFFFCGEHTPTNNVNTFFLYSLLFLLITLGEISSYLCTILAGT
eukprot:gene10088-7058_t